MKGKVSKILGYMPSDNQIEKLAKAYGEEKEKIYQALNNRQNQLDNQLSKIMNGKPINQVSMLIVNAQTSEVQMMKWFIEELEDDDDE